MSITGLHIPCDGGPFVAVRVDERNAISYYPFVHGGPVEAAYLELEGLELVMYVNSRYTELDESAGNLQATALLTLADVGFAGSMIRGDTLIVQAPGNADYERSLPPDLISAWVDATS